MRRILLMAGPSQGAISAALIINGLHAADCWARKGGGCSCGVGVAVAELKKERADGRVSGIE